MSNDVTTKTTSARSDDLGKRFASIRARAYYLDHRDAVLQKNREWRQNNPEAVAAIQRRYYKKHREKCLALQKQWRERTNYYERNKEAIKARARQWQLDNPERVKAQQQIQAERRRQKRAAEKAAKEAAK